MLLGGRKCKLTLIVALIACRGILCYSFERVFNAKKAISLFQEIRLFWLIVAIDFTNKEHFKM